MKTAASGLDLTRLAAFACSVVALMMLVFSAYLARHPAAVMWHGDRVAGEVLEIVAVVDEGGQLKGYAPVVAYITASGQRYTFTRPFVGPVAAYATGDRVSVYYDRVDPTLAALSNFHDFWLLPMLTAGGAGLFLLLAGILASSAAGSSPAPAFLARAERDHADVLQFHPLNQIAHKHYLAHIADPRGAAKVQISEAATALGDGRHPVVLCEFLAGMTALAASADAPTYIAENLGHIKGARAFGPEGGRGLAFLFEEIAFVIPPSTLPAGPLRWLRQIMSLKTSGRCYVPPDTAWHAPPRHRSLSRWWDEMREEVEVWVAEEALKRDPARPFFFAGHGLGGGLAILAAYEFKQCARNLAGVVTFNSPQPGGREFARDYQQLGLDDATLNVNWAAGAPLAMQWPFLYRTVGNVWMMSEAPLTGRRPSPVHKDGRGLVTFVLDALGREERSSTPMVRTWRRRMLLRLGTFSRRARSALAVHEIERFFLLGLTTLAYRRLRGLLAEGDTREDQQSAATAYQKHVVYLRGAMPASSGTGPFGMIAGLPVMIEDVADLTALRSKFPGRVI